jgi:hypothetical protein
VTARRQGQQQIPCGNENKKGDNNKVDSKRGENKKGERGLGFFGVGFVGFLFEELAEAVEAALPEGTAVGDPLFGGGEAGGFYAAGADSSEFGGADEAALLEDLKVLHDGG